ncbi:MAG TPA: hypothetical protein VFS43_23495 [Polyangiaceae bacterium]|nr:hypothetical protein [Polyangiaceae bacterium]
MATEPGLRAAGAEGPDRAALDRALQSHDVLRQRLGRLAAFAAAAPSLKGAAEAERLLRLDALVSAWRGEDAPYAPLAELF